MEADIERSPRLQNDDGGLVVLGSAASSRRRGSRSRSRTRWCSREGKGYDVPDAMLAAALRVPAPTSRAHIPGDCSHEVRVARSAPTRSTCARCAGDRDVAKATGIYEARVDKLQLEAMAWLWPSIDDAVDPAPRSSAAFENAATETAGAATFATSYGEDDYLLANSDRRTDGVMLEALIGETARQRSHPQGRQRACSGTQSRGRWNNAQENAFVLLALDRYFHTYEKVTPDFVARVWLGDDYAGEHAFKGRTTDRDNTLRPDATS